MGPIYLVRYGEPVYQVTVQEHSEDNLESGAVTKLSVIELVTEILDTILE